MCLFVAAAASNQVQEVLAGTGKYDLSADVFSFAIVLAEIATRAVPYDDVADFPPSPIAAMRFIQDGGRPSLPDDAPVWLASLTRMCWSGSPSNRPTFGEILDIFEREMDGSASSSATSDATERLLANAF